MVVDRLRQIEKFVRTIPCANAVAERLDCAAQILSRNPDVSELRVNIQNDKKKPSVPAGFQGTLTAQLIGKSGTILDPSLFHPCTVPVLTEASTVGLGSATLPGFPSLDFHYQCLGVGSVLLSLHAAFVPSQVQDINGGIVAASLPVPGDGLVVLRPFPMPTLMTILQVNRVDLRIFRPKASGGAEIDDAKSVTPGGFTVANKNDSNSDETIDSTQEDYKGERDLIKLRIIRGANDVGPLTVTLDLPAVTPAAHQDLQNELDAAHRARMVTSMLLYEDEGLKKRVGDGKLPEDVTIPKGKNSIEVYIEGLNESMRVRDMLIVARVNRAGAPVEEDMVALTFIWATIDGPETKHDNIGAGPILWPDVTNPPSGGFAPFGNFGLRNRIAPTGTGIYANVIGMRATVYPPGIDLEPDVKFDVTRDKEGRTWLIESDGDVALMQTFDFPKTDDQANDDGDTAPIIDQSIDPNAARHFFSIDAPRVLGDPKAQEFLVIRSLNFREWMRVRVDGKYPRGNTSEGSRCSDKFNWHSRHLYRDQNPGGGRQWVRINMAGAATALVETPPNFQGLGNNIHIGHTPMPAKISTTVPGTFPLKVDKFQK